MLQAHKYFDKDYECDQGNWFWFKIRWNFMASHDGTQSSSVMQSLFKKPQHLKFLGDYPTILFLSSYSKLRERYVCKQRDTRIAQ